MLWLMKLNWDDVLPNKRSHESYEAVIYCKLHPSRDEVKIRLITSKFRVLSMKQIIIPRLELRLAVTIAKLIPRE